MSDFNFIRLEEKHIATVRQFFLNPVAHFLANPQEEYPKNESYYKTILNASENQLFGIEYESKLIASLILKSVKPKLFQLQNLFLAKAYRGQSLSKKLIRFSIKSQAPKTSFKSYVHQQQREQLRLFRELDFVASETQYHFDFEGKAEAFYSFERSL